MTPDQKRAIRTFCAAFNVSANTLAAMVILCNEIHQDVQVLEDYGSRACEDFARLCESFGLSEEGGK